MNNTYEHDDILEGFASSGGNQSAEMPVRDEFTRMMKSYIFSEMRRNEARDEAFGKLLKKVKKMKNKLEDTGVTTKNKKKKKSDGRWDKTIEKSVPEVLKFATAVVGQMPRNKKGGG